MARKPTIYIYILLYLSAKYLRLVQITSQDINKYALLTGGQHCPREQH